jgi:hypothetical protein
VKNLFVVKLAVRLGFEFLKKSAPSWVGSFLLGGPLGMVLTVFAEWFLGMLINEGVLAVDFGLISANVAIELDEYKAFAKEAYEKSTKKVYSEEEKHKIRDEYLDALRKFASIGNGLR